ncbi:MAG TPA: phosphoenolpyruvate--protein phosphotransferase [Gemmatimonadaceae bacterium]|nr:phosphoenolpyruvate--protein phosphotransferase [Gemmatimonadaceae bacterium]
MQHAIRGVPASPGIVHGPVHLLRWEVPDVRHRIIADEAIPDELDRLHDAMARAKDRLRKVRDRVERRVGAKDASIFEAQLLILEDPDMLAEIEDWIRQNTGAEKAFDLVMVEQRQRFARHELPMIRERVGDLTDVHIRVLSILLGLADHDPVDVPKGAGAVLVTHDLTPSLTVQLDREAIAGIATDAGTRTSHVAILARSLGLPAVVGLRDATQRVRVSDSAILDGTRGLLAINPTADEVDGYRTRAIREAESEAELSLLSGEEPLTRDGVRVTLRVNIDIPEDAEAAALSGAEGVGLMRTEFLVIGRTDMPDEDEQYAAYRKVVDAFRGFPIVIRTYDIGGDKLPVGGYPHEPNPFLGWRAIRMCLDEPELFRTQLRALLRAAVHGDVHILLPLIVSLEEVRQARALLEQAAAELRERGVAHRADVPLGVMIETPAAAVVVDTFVDDVAFFSLGTNDLVQYTLAIDRGNANLVSRFTPLHPAVLRLIRRTVEVGAASGVDVAVCGEMASQPLTALVLIGLGVRQLSVGARSVGRIKRLIRSVDAAALEEAALAALALDGPAAVEADLSRRLAGAGVDPALVRDVLPSLSDGDIISLLERS